MGSGEHARRVRELFEAALELEGAERGRLLEEACKGDEALRKEVEELLAHHSEARTDSLLPPGEGRVAARTRASARPQRGTTLGRYLVLHELGAGGMGVVLAAYDMELERKVALKLLADSLGTEPEVAEGRARLVREAQAMARIQHPNVVSVYEVVVQEGLVCVAMELVAGVTLGQWLEEQARPWQQVLQHFLAAGRGLAAAHAAGLVHRDFKPSNVLIGQEGRVRVTDFGLARLASPRGEAPAPGSPPEPGSEAPAGLHESVTREGRLVGTLRYMAPEQHLGQAPDARSDQFSFCTALYAALYGQHPFEPLRLAAAARQVLPGGGPVPEQSSEVPAAPLLREPPRRSRVPWWVRRAVWRGLALRPEERFPSMEELLAALSGPPPAWRRARLAAGGVVAAGLLALGGLGLARWQSSLCSGARQQLSGTWDEGVQGRIQAAFAASGRPYASTTWETVRTGLEEYSRSWVAMHTEACEATRLRGEQTEALLALRMTCLERRRKALWRTTHALAQAEGAQVEQALELVEGLPSLEGCANVEALSARLEPPGAPEQRAEYDRISAQVEQSRAEETGGRYEAALALSQSAVEAARALGHPGLLAETLFQQGGMQYSRGDLKAATQSYVEAWRGADAARDDELRAMVGSALTFSIGYRQGRVEEGIQWAALSQAVLDRMGASEDQQAQLLLNLGAVLGGAGRRREARETLERALELTGRVPGARSRYRWQVLVNLAVACSPQDNERSIRLLQEAESLIESRFGPGHPNLGALWSNLAEFLALAGRPAQALEYGHKALTLLESLHGAEHFMVGYATHSLSVSLEKLGRLSESRAYAQRSLAVLERSLGPEHGDVAWPLSQLGLIHLRLGQPEQAAPLLERALGLNNGNEQVRGQVRFTLARTLEALGREHRRSLALAAEARDLLHAAGLEEDAAAVEAWLARGGR